MNTLGIDFGTTTTLAAFIDPSTGRPEPIQLGRSGPEIPTTIHVDARGQFLYGEDADDQFATDPSGYQRRVKLGLGTSRRFLLNGHEFTAVDLAAKFLAHVRQRVETEHFHGKVDHAVVTVPAMFGPAARADLREAVGRAGFASFELLDEPVAAGIAFLEEKKGSELGEEILVFDWGGGTLDIALVERSGEHWSLNPNHLEGDADLGVEHIDGSLMRAVNESLEKNGKPKLTPKDSQDYPAVYRRVVEMKRQLSKKDSHSFRHITRTCELEFACTRGEFEEFIAGVLDRAMDCVARWRCRSGATAGGNGRVLLVGGSSQIPAVARRLEEKGMRAIPWTRGLQAVAFGAALHAKRDAKQEKPGGKQAGASNPPKVSTRHRIEIAGPAASSQAPPPPAGKPTEKKVAEPTLQEKAESGDVPSMVELGIALMKGEGMGVDLGKGFLWLHRAAQSGHANAMNWTGYCHEHGKGVPLNLPLAVEQYHLSADRGNAEGMYRLGRMYEGGRGLPQSRDTATEWFRKAAAAGHKEAGHALTVAGPPDLVRGGQAGSGEPSGTGSGPKPPPRPGDVFLDVLKVVIIIVAVFAMLSIIVMMAEVVGFNLDRVRNKGGLAIIVIYMIIAVVKWLSSLLFKQE